MPQPSLRVMAETILPAAPVIRKTLLLSSTIPGWPSAAGCSSRPTVQRWSAVYPISTAPGSCSVSSISRSATSAALRFGSKSTRFDQAFRAFPFVCLDKARRQRPRAERLRPPRRSRAALRAASPRPGTCLDVPTCSYKCASWRTATSHVRARRRARLPESSSSRLPSWSSAGSQ